MKSYMRQWAGDWNWFSIFWYLDSSRTKMTTNYNAAAITATGKNADPSYFGGLSNTFTYKGFSLVNNFLLQMWKLGSLTMGSLS